MKVYAKKKIRLNVVLSALHVSHVIIHFQYLNWIY